MEKPPMVTTDLTKIDQSLITACNLQGLQIVQFIQGASIKNRTTSRVFNTK